MRNANSCECDPVLTPLIGIADAAAATSIPKVLLKMNGRERRTRKKWRQQGRAHLRTLVKWELIAVVRCGWTTLKWPMAIYCRNLIKIYWISVINPMQLDGEAASAITAHIIILNILIHCERIHLRISFSIFECAEWKSKKRRKTKKNA